MHVALRKYILTTFCTKKLHVVGTSQGKDDEFRHAARRNDKLRDVLQRREHPLDVLTARRRQYGQNALRSE